MKPLDVFKETSEGFPVFMSRPQDISSRVPSNQNRYFKPKSDLIVHIFDKGPPRFNFSECSSCVCDNNIGFLRQNNQIFDGVGFNISEGDTWCSNICKCSSCVYDDKISHFKPKHAQQSWDHWMFLRRPQRASCQDLRTSPVVFHAIKTDISSQNMILLCIFLTRDYHVSTLLEVPAAFVMTKSDIWGKTILFLTGWGSTLVKVIFFIRDKIVPISK